jgi:imidazolonepropionase-like amidohydrolase
VELLISAGTVLTGPAGDRIADGAVLVDDDRIVTVGSRSEVGAQAGPAARALDAAMFARVRWMADLGVRLIADTDAGVPRAVFNDFVGSLEFFAHLGFPTDRVIEMATIDAAEALGIAEQTGRIAPGHTADLLVVDGDPLHDIGALRDSRLVVAAGRTHLPARTVVGA